MTDTAIESYRARQADLATILYSPLRDWETRILTIDPGPKGGPIRAKLSIVILIHDEGIGFRESGMRGFYQALSYCWGEPLFSHVLVVNDVGYPITSSLYEALQALRKTDKAINIWVDAICINQHDRKERASQVQKMLTIYEKAASVVVWLGIDDRDAATALAISNTDDVSMQDSASRLGNEKFCEAILGVLRKPWFSRRWVLQEVWAARQVLVALDEITVPWAALQAGATLLLRLFDQHALPGLFGAKAFVEDTVARFRENSGRQGLVEVLRRSVGFDCSDLRDVVYAVAGMSDALIRAESTSQDETKPALRIDYSTSPYHIFENTTAYLRQQKQDLSILFLDGSRGPGRTHTFDHDSGLASWSFYWERTTREGEWHWLYLKLQREYHHLWRGCGCDEQGCYPQVTFPARSTLRVNGRLVAVVKHNSARHQGTGPAVKVVNVEIPLNIAVAEANAFSSIAKSANWTMDGLKLHKERPRYKSTFGFSKTPESLIRYSTLQQATLTELATNPTIQCHLATEWMTFPGALAGDVMVLLDGDAMPILLRPTNNPSEYLFVGGALPRLRVQTLSQTEKELGDVCVLSCELRQFSLAASDEPKRTFQIV